MSGQSYREAKNVITLPGVRNVVVHHLLILRIARDDW